MQEPKEVELRFASVRSVPAYVVVILMLVVTPMAATAQTEENKAELNATVSYEESVKPSEVGSHGQGEGKLSLEECIGVALKRNRDVLNAKDNTDSSEYRREAAEREFSIRITPQINVSRKDDSLNKGRTEIETYGVTLKRRFQSSTTAEVAANTSTSEQTKTSEDTSQSEVKLTLTQPLLRGVGYTVTTDPLKTARRAVETQQRTLELTNESVIFTVVSAFMEIVRAREIYEINDRAWKRDLKLLEGSRAKQSVGLATNLDVSRAFNQASQSEDAAITAKQSWEDARDSMKLLLDFRVESATEFEDDPHLLAYPALDDLALSEEEQVDLASEKRVDLAEAADAVEDAERKVRVARNATWPTLDLGLSYRRFDEGDDYEESRKLRENEWAIELTGSQTLDRSTELAEYRSSLKSLDIAHRAHDLVRDQIIQEVRQSIRNVKRTWEQMQIQKANSEQARQRLKQAEIGFERGIIDNFAYTDAESTLVQAESNEISAITNYITALAGLERATGTIDDKWAPFLTEQETDGKTRPK